MNLATTQHQQYAEVMQRMWANPANDQRPAVQKWLSRELGLGLRIVDFGCGDAYYLQWLQPSVYLGVDPNPILLQDAVRKTRMMGIKAWFFDSVAAANGAQRQEIFDAKLLLHSLLYLSINEAQIALSEFAASTCLIVHPLPEKSTTIAFESSLGINVARELVSLKQKLLGKPNSSVAVATHLCFDAATTSNEELAFVLAHRALPYGDAESIIESARRLIEEERQSWTSGGVVKIPQWQLMESYAL